MAKKIQLTKGKFAIVDDENFQWLNQWKWQAKKRGNTYYAERTVYLGGGKKNRKDECIEMHRLILGLTKNDGKTSDHRDGNGLNNLKENLRICTISQNQHNQRRSRGSSKYKGVHWSKTSKKWIVQIACNNKRIRLRSFENEEEAAKAYDQKAKELHGKYASLNFLGI